MRNFFGKMFGWCCDRHSFKGKIVLGCGQHEITIIMGCRPECVKLHIESDGVPVCHGDVNEVQVRLTPHGFVLTADIRTNTCTVGWACECE